ncbi:Mitochondrial-processing peptidase subunit alpha [Acorus gramineus]|uniref:Mitochondrial-processing peptidase subunit alpha n=1 Tax=Acorus gramineus TaxID=55184 RepID=A0AAV9ALT0_ACOGR|nr:Mitochondrial-processing peptidase subunit alpha [Acorus gramineus]
MYRASSVASRARNLKGHSCDGAAIGVNAARYASTSIAKTSSPEGFFGWLFGEKSKTLPPPEFPLPGVIIPPALPDHVETGQTKITTLPNGVKIASETAPGPVASLGLYINAGSTYETPISLGGSHLLEKMAFKSTLNRSHLRVVREVEAIGGRIGSSAHREQMGYTYAAIKTHVPEMVEVLVDCVRNPAFLDWEVNEQLMRVKEEIEESANNPHNLVLEAIHAAGYSGALANPLMASESAISRLNSSILEEYVVENYTAPRMVLAASGVEHEELLSVAEPLLSDLPKVPLPQAPKSKYIGGDFRRQTDTPKTHVALAFEVPGGWHNEKDAMTLNVILMLMGGGGSFSAGGPGKGMYSRLYLRVLNEYPQIQSFSSFANIYDNTGFFGIYAATESDFASQVVDIASREILAIATPGEVDQKQLDRAKETTKSAVLMSLETRTIASDDIGRQILTYGERKPIELYLKSIDTVTLKDITSLAQKIISSRLTMTSCGDVRNVPSYDSVSSKFHAK